jgi:ATP-dependent Clp protease ATP-binding subunit ClpC
MFERHNDKARRAIFFARYEASLLGSPRMEAEHLLLGVIREDKRLMTHFLSHESLESIRWQIEQHAPAHERVAKTSVDLPMSEGCRRVLAHAETEADRLSHRPIGTDHLLLGLLRDEESFAAQVLHQCGLDFDAVRQYAADPRPTFDGHPGQDQGRVTAASQPTRAETLDDIKAELMSLIGLEPVKRDFLSISNLLRVRQLRKHHDLNTEGLSLHLVFTGIRAPVRQRSPGSSRAPIGARRSLEGTFRGS